MAFIKKYISFFLLFFSVGSYAQFLPDNVSLNVQSVQRWMDSNRDFVNIVQVLEPMHQSEEDLKKFEGLPAEEQDLQISAFLKKNNLENITREVVARHGWKSVGEYMRLSTKLGNAIAAYFFSMEADKLTQEQQKALRAKTDAAVLNASKEDVEFVRSHETLLKAYIQAYSQGRK